MNRLHPRFEDVKTDELDDSDKNSNPPSGGFLIQILQRIKHHLLNKFRLLISDAFRIVSIA